MEVLPRVAVIELGSQYTLVIERSLRELGIRSVILNLQEAPEWIAKHPIDALILSGGVSSIYEKNAPKPSGKLLSLKTRGGKPVPVLAICYGMQWLAYHFGGSVTRGDPEYGKARIKIIKDSQLFKNTPILQEVWASHGDSVTTIPKGFRIVATSGKKGIAAIQHAHRPLFGVQFHPEVLHTRFGKKILQNFLQDVAGCKRDWAPRLAISSIQEEVRAQVGNKKAIFGFSGGVDSTTLSAILSPVLKKRLLAITIDGGHLRENELEEIERNARAAKVRHIIIDARNAFEQTLRTTIDAEEKRKRFKKVYVRLFVSEAQKFGAKFIIQGTLAPDRIESGATGGALIKSHHNVGLAMGRFIQLHPIDHLFKYEIRALGKELGLPSSVYKREPFPGPGNFIRVIGVPVTKDKLAIVSWAQARTREILTQHGLYENISQLVVAYLGVNTVGVKGDGRVYRGSIVVRPIETSDWMTTRAVHLPPQVEDEIIARLTSHPQIVRTWFDYTQKPPATTEME